MKKRLIVDVSSVIWTALMKGEDKEFGRKVEHNGKPFQVNGSAYGLEGSLELIHYGMERLGIVPKDIILCVEGLNAKSLRRSMYSEYKSKSDGDKPEDAYVEFRKTREMLQDILCDVGAQAISQNGVEGDDLVDYLCMHLDGEKYIMSNDGDLARCMTHPNTHILKGGRLDENGCGPFDPKYITLYKALVGDTGDTIPGAKGFGDKAWLDLMCVFGNEGLDALEDLIRKRRLEALAEDVGELKALQKIIDAKEMVYQCYAAARLYPNMVGTLRNPLEWRVGMVKPLTKATDERLKPFAGRTRLIGLKSFEDSLAFIASKMGETTEVGLDIETSTPQESDDWLMALKGLEEGDDLGVDTLGSILTGLGFTFGNNNQYTFYFSVDHKDSDNIPAHEVLKVVKLIRKGIPVVVHNNAFEQPVLKKTWQDDVEWQMNGWSGFLPNVYDTAIMASYVNENEARGLKKLSKRILSYDQQSYDQTTRWVNAYMPREVPDLKKDGTPKLDRDGKPKTRTEKDYIGEMWLKDLPEGAGYDPLKQFKMNELSAEHVFGYGADDPICTVALFNHFRTIMEIEKTWSVFEQVEILPAYLTAEAYVKGTKLSLERMFELEKEDNKTFDENWAIVRNYLLDKGWDGTVCPEVTELEPAQIKLAFQIITGEELDSRVRLPAKLADDIEAQGNELLAELVRKGDLTGINKLVKSKFTGEPILDFDSPKKMQKFLYTTLGLPVALINNPTEKERETNKPLAEACYKHNKIFKGSQSTDPLTDEEKELIKAKATTDDDAINWALAFDATPEQKVILEAVQKVKTVMTRRKLFYKPYRNIKHWSDGKVHPSLNQCAAVTRRYSSSGPNVQQLPKKGEGVKFREIYVPHKPGAVICSIDFSGQELRLMAGQSLDKNMMDCYVGKKLKDIHSITGTGIMMKKWGAAVVEELFGRFGGGIEDGPDREYDLFMRLRKEQETAKKANDTRKDAKNVNFAAQFDAMAPKLAVMLTVSVTDAQIFLDAKYEMFPRVETWKEDVREQLIRDGFVTTMLGARRHLGHVVTSNNKWEVERAGRQGPNFKIQGSAAEMSKLAMGRVWSSGITQKLDMVFIAPIHDELVWSVMPEDLMESIRVVHTSMTQPYATLPVPILGSISFGPNFGVQVEVGDEFDPENIVKELEHWADDPKNAKWQNWSHKVLAAIRPQVLAAA